MLDEAESRVQVSSVSRPDESRPVMTVCSIDVSPTREEELDQGSSTKAGSQYKRGGRPCMRVVNSEDVLNLSIRL